MRKAIIPIVCVALVTIILLSMAFFFRDNIMYSYYEKKGDSSNSLETSIDYYTKALKYNYTDEIIDKITDRVKEDDEFEEILNDLNGKLRKSDLNDIYVEVYISKAKENFNNKNYETTLNYLYKDEEYN